METESFDRTELVLELYRECCNKSREIEIVSKNGRKVSINSFVLGRFSPEMAKITKGNSSIFMDEDFETIVLLRDILTVGEGRFSGIQDEALHKLMAASRSLNVKLSENFAVQEANMSIENFISGVDDIMKTSYTVDEEATNVKDDYNISTEVFIDKIDSIFTSTLKRDVLQNMLEHANTTPKVSYICDFCLKTFASENKLTKHLVCHTQFSCFECGKGFRIQSLLNFHLKEQHNQSMETLEEHTSVNQSNQEDEPHEYACKQCDKVFKSKKKLANHSLCHTNIKCSICFKGFRMPSLLARHMKTEHGEEVDKSLQNESILKRQKLKKNSFIAAIKSNLNIH